MPHFLVSGIGALAAEVAGELREQGSTAVEVDDIADVPRACTEAGAGVFDGYLQLPATFVVSGSTAVERVHHFFSGGVLARFPAMTAALPALRPDASITFVTGVLPPEVSTDEDIAARAALLRILGHAAHADGPAGLRVSMLDSGASPREIALAALGRDPDRESVIADFSGEGSYADWRVELLGMMSAQM